MAIPEKIKILMKKGVQIPCPGNIEIGDEIDTKRIAKDVVIHSGCKIYGKDTYIMSGARLGYEAPVTIHNCYIGNNVHLKGGAFYKSVFLDGVEIGSGAQIREGCLLEEGSRCAHVVGLKQTILFPFVTLGSLINFCDCLMAGGTDKKNHSEVGSSYIHFNYTPNQDKATASLIGDVPRGVMLKEPPIFLGGQGGIVGPVRITYGVVVAAETIIRKDLLEENTLFIDYPARVSKKMPFHRGLYNNPKRIFDLNIIYIANLIALRRWYLDVRSIFMEMEILIGALEKIDMGISERIKRLEEVVHDMPDSIELYKKVKRHSDRIVGWKKRLHERWLDVKGSLIKNKEFLGDPEKKECFMSYLANSIKENGKDYLAAIKGLDKKEARAGTSWLQEIVDRVANDARSILS